MLTDEAALPPIKVYGVKNGRLKDKYVPWPVITGLGRGLLWMFYCLERLSIPKLWFDRRSLSRWDPCGSCAPLCMCCGPGICSYGRKRLFALGSYVNENTERERNRTYELACPLPWCYSKRAWIGHTPTTDRCTVSLTTDLGGPRTSALLGVGKNSSSWNHETDSQLQLYVYDSYWH